MEKKVMENKIRGIAVYIICGLILGIFIKNNASKLLTDLYYIVWVILGLGLIYLLFLKDLIKKYIPPRGKNHGI